MVKIETLILCFSMFAMITTPCFAETAVNDYVLDESALDRCIKRLIEVQRELGRLGIIFEQSAARMEKGWPEQEIEKRIVEEANRIRIPGFCAYHLADEGMALLNLIALRITLLRKGCANSKRLQKLTEMQEYAEEVEPFMRQTLKAMEPYNTLDARETIESLARKYRSLHP
ncbi:MAG: hypothetical protein ACFFCW_39270 [Candidatus Hodarchaeota archaeon]